MRSSCRKKEGFHPEVKERKIHKWQNDKNHAHNSYVYKQLLLRAMKEQWASATAQMTRENNKVDTQVDKMLETFLGKDSDKKVSESDLSAISDPYRAKNEWELIDPLDLYNEIQELEKEIDEFLADVDTRLSISNSVTYIEV